MKKLLALFLAVIMLCSVHTSTGAEEDISQYVHIAYAGYDGVELFGEVEIPDGQFFIRATFFLPGNFFFVIIFPISREGLFQLYIDVDCEFITIQVVDSPMALLPMHGTVYASAPVSFIEGCL